MDERHKAAEVASRTPEFMAREASKPFCWDPALWVEWATVATMLEHAGLAPGARLLDVGSGSGWTSLFLAEARYDVLGVDLVPANVVSPGARRVRRELGWLERGITLRSLRRDLRAAGCTAPQRVWQGTRPYGAGRGLPAQLARLLAARVAVAPQHHLWLAARRMPT